MYTVKKDNVVYDIDGSQLEHYRSRGYEIVSVNGDYEDVALTVDGVIIVGGETLNSADETQTADEEQTPAETQAASVKRRKTENNNGEAVAGEDGNGSDTAENETANK